MDDLTSIKNKSETQKNKVTTDYFYEINQLMIFLANKINFKCLIIN